MVLESWPSTSKWQDAGGQHEVTRFDIPVTLALEADETWIKRSTKLGALRISVSFENLNVEQNGCI